MTTPPPWTTYSNWYSQVTQRSALSPVTSRSSSSRSTSRSASSFAFGWTKMLTPREVRSRSTKSLNFPRCSRVILFSSSGRGASCDTAGGAPQGRTEIASPIARSRTFMGSSSSGVVATEAARFRRGGRLREDRPLLRRSGGGHRLRPQHRIRILEGRHRGLRHLFVGPQTGDENQRVQVAQLGQDRQRFLGTVASGRNAPPQLRQERLELQLPDDPHRRRSQVVPVERAVRRPFQSRVREQIQHRQGLRP